MKKVLLSMLVAAGFAGAAVSAQAATYVTTTHRSYHHPIVVKRVYHRPVHHHYDHRPVVVERGYHR